MKGKSHKRFGVRILKRVISATLVAVMFFTMVGIYIPADTFKASDSANITIHFKAESWMDEGMKIQMSDGQGWSENREMQKDKYSSGWYSITIENYNKAAFHYQIKGSEGGQAKESFSTVLGTNLSGDYECWTSLKDWSEDTDGVWRFSLNVSTTAPDDWGVDPIRDVTIHFKDVDWLDDGINLHVWDNSNPKNETRWPGYAMDENADNAGWYSITLKDYSWNGFNYIINGTEKGNTKQSVDSVISDSDINGGYECWITMGDWEGDKFKPVVSTTAPEGWKDKIYTYTMYIQDDWDAEKSVIHAWSNGQSGKNYTLTEVEESFNGENWLKAEFQATSSIGFLLKNTGDDWKWQTADMTHKNTTGEDQTLYYVNGKLYRNIEDVPDFSDASYVYVEYAGQPSAGKSVYTWENGYSQSGFFVPFREMEDGTFVAKIPVKMGEASEKNIGFLVNSAPRWDNASKEGGDNFYTLSAEDGFAKILFSGGTIARELTEIKSSLVNRKTEKITFNYRDNTVFAETGIGMLAANAVVKVHVIEKTDAGQSAETAYAMTYDASVSAYTCKVDLKADTDYYYYYTVDGVEVVDNNTSRKAELGGKTYSYNRNKVYNVKVEADTYYDNMDYDQSNLISITYGPATDKDSMDGFKVEHIYLDLSELGLGSKVEISKDLLEGKIVGSEIKVTFGCADTVAAGEKTVRVILVDDCDMEYVGTVNVNVTERNKTDDFDWDEAVIYFAVTDRFYDGNTANNTVTDDGKQTTAYDKNNALGIHGGDFAGLTAKLDYLEDLGVNTIWITPIVDNIDELVDDENKSSAYHGYWAEDFETLNPHLGTEAEFEALIDAAHAKGMKIMVDVVLNHAGYMTDDIFNEKIEIGKDPSGNSVYKDMIRGEEETVEGDEEKSGLSGLPDFMTEDPEVRALLIAWQTSWISKFDIDYYRVDTVKHVDDVTWIEFKNELTKINSRFKLIGEYYDGGYRNDFDQLGTGMMDSILDFHFNDILSALTSENLLYIEEALQQRNALLNNTATMGSFLSSHDENGFLYELRNKKDSWGDALMKVAATYQITAKGQPVIYYGEEIGMTGANNYPLQDNRYDFDWSKVNNNNAMYVHYKKMLNIRQDYSEIFAKGDRYGVVIPDTQSDKDGTKKIQGYEVFARSYQGETIYVGTNVWGDAKQVTFYVDGGAGSTYTNLYDGKTYTVSAEGTVTVTIPGAANGGTVVLAKTDGTANTIEDTNEVTIVFHYKRPNNDYTNWNAWIWAEGIADAQHDFEKVNGEMVTSVTVDGRVCKEVNYRIRYGEWKDNDHGGKDQYVDISKIVSGTVHYYIEQGVWGGTMVLGSDAVVGNKVVKTGYDRVMNTFTFTTTRPIVGAVENAFEIVCTTDNKVISISDVEGNGCVYTVKIDDDLTAMTDVLKSYQVKFDGYVYNIVMPNIYTTSEFEKAYTYDGDDLGLTYTKDKSTFKVWAPTAENMVLNVYESGTKGNDDKIASYQMVKAEKGVWVYELSGDWNGKYYTYTVSVNNKTSEVCDPYARTTGVNGNRAMILDLDSTDPEGWEEDKDKKLHEGMAYTDAVIYELHVRDLTIDDSSGADNQGKFLGLTETGTTTADGTPTGLDHMIDLGITHLHLLPIYDYASVDETQLDKPQFNWGYDPLNYNVPEGSYSTNPYDGASRVSEMKQMVKALHDNNINVIMDVVYNHVYNAGTFGFNQIVPNYFSRTTADGKFSNGSGCGNDTATERSMVHKYVVESILYWHDEYHIDGFRFDLVGLLDTVTINKIVADVHAIDPDIIFYGEGWTLGTAVGKDGYYMATQANAHMTPGFAYFSDTLRNGVAGSDTNGQGFIWVSGKEDLMRQCFTATTSWCPQPTQTINYVSCHDNYTLMDKINEVSNAPYNSYDDAPGAYQVRLNNLAASFYMLSEGIPFIHAGEEFLRTKLEEGTNNIIHNSYNASDYVNKLRWYNLDGDPLYKDTVEYYEGLIEFRKNHEALRLDTKEEVAANVTYSWIANDVIMFTIKGKASVPGEASDSIVIIFNASGSDANVNFYSGGAPQGNDWHVCIDKDNAGTKALKTVTNGQVTVPSKSCMALVKGATVDTDTVYMKNNNVTISVDETSNVQVGGTVKLTATVNPANSTLIWTSSNEAVAKVDANGNVTAVSKGTATITVSTLHDVTATCEVTVVDATETITLNKTEVTLAEKTTETLVATTEPEDCEVTWSSSDETVATVDENGKVTAVGGGKATITATTQKGANASCEVTVTHGTIVPVAAVPATCTKAGMDAHYKCEGCGELFKDAEGTVSVTEKELKTAPLGHDLKEVVGTPATCTEDGVSSHYQCETCKVLFADVKGQNVVTSNEVVIVAKGHTVTKVEAKPATTTATGNKEHYVCGTCNKLFLDKEATKETSLKDVTIEKLQPETPPVNPEEPVDPPVEKEEVVYVPETEIEEQVSGEVDKLLEKLENNESLEGVVSEETLEKIQEAISNNKNIITKLVIDNKKDVEVETAVKELINSALNKLAEDAEANIAQYLDIKVVLKVEGSQDELGTLNKLSEKITLTFEIPDEWKKEGRVFSVIRVHEGRTDVLEVRENQDGTVSFDTDRFSTYALVYTDVEEDDDNTNPTPTPTPTPGEPTTPSNPTTPEAPKTGDYSGMIAFFLVLLAGIGAAFFGLGNAARKRAFRGLMSLVLVVVMLFGMVAVYIPAEEYTAEEVDNFTIRFANTAGWSTVNAYIWDTGNNDALINGTWPGTKMTKGSDNEWTWTGNWKDTYKIIFNDGNSQTDNLVLSTDQIQAWNDWKFTYNSTWTRANVVIDAEPITIGFKNTQNWSTVYAYIWDIDGTLHNNAWPGAMLTKTDDEGNLIWSHDSWNINDDLKIIFSNGTDQTMDLVITSENFETSKSWILVPSEKENGKWRCDFINGEAGEVVKPETTSVKLYFKNTENWSKVNAYVWNDSTYIVGWPGAEVQLDATTGYYVWSYDEWVVTDNLKVIFNNGGDGNENQTADIVIGKEALAENTEWYIIPTSQNNEYKWSCEKFDTLPTISIDKETLELKEGATATITPTLNPDNLAVTWKSSDSTIATVVNGVITAKKAGTATITATTLAGSKTCEVTVTHDLIEVAAKESNCTETGNSKHYKCNVCSKLFEDANGTIETDDATVTIPVSHELEIVPENAATCTVDGNKEHYACENCDALFWDAEGTEIATVNDVTIKACHKPEKVDAVDATCTTDGNIEYYECSVCHKFYEDEACMTELDSEAVIDLAKGHKLDEVAAKNPTNTIDGNLAHYECSVCHDLFKDAEGTQPTTEQEVTIPALGHVLTLVPAKEATCTEAGVKAHYTCSHCDKLFTDETGTQEFEGTTVIPAAGHKTEKVAAKDETLTEAGSKEHYKCTVCEKLFWDEEATQAATEEEVTIPALGHVLTLVPAKDATCTEAGVKAHYICSHCDKLFTDETGTQEFEGTTVIPAAGHKTEKVAAKDETLTEAGIKEHYKCTVCEKLFWDEEATQAATAEEVTIPALGHVLTLVPAKEATCTEAGVKAHYTCSHCDKLFTDETGTQEFEGTTVIPAAGHKTEKVAAKDETLTEAGIKEHYKCTVCEKLFWDEEATQAATEEEVTIPALGHVLTLVPAKEATCTEAGNHAHYTCSHCDKHFTDATGTQEFEGTTVIPAKGHDLTEVAAKEPTTTATGNKEHYVCETCDKLFLDEAGKNETTLEEVTIDKLQSEEPKPETPEAPVVKDETVYVPENKVEEQVKEETTDLVNKIKDTESATDVVEEGIISEETLAKVETAIEEGKTIVTELVIENKKGEEVAEETIKLVEDAAKDIIEDANTEIAQYLDIKVVLKDSEAEELGTLNKLSEEITLTFEIPDEWKKEGRKFHVIRVHEGKTDVLDVWENEDGTVSFKTDRFSTYALVYTDADTEDEIVPTPPTTPEEPAKPNVPTAPQTGDNSMPGVYFLVLLAGFAVAMAGVANKRKYVK